MALPATDNFNRANAANLGANWTAQAGNMQVTSNEIGANGASSSTENGVYWNADTFGDDQYSQVIAASVESYAGAGAACRIATNTDDSWYGFYSDTSYLYFFKMVSGTWTSIDSDSTPASTSDVIKIDAEGTTITGYRNGSSQATNTDSALASGAAGVTSWGDGVGTTVDDWEGGNLGSPPADIYSILPAFRTVRA